MKLSVHNLQTILENSLRLIRQDFQNLKKKQFLLVKSESPTFFGQEYFAKHKTVW